MLHHKTDSGKSRLDIVLQRNSKQDKAKRSDAQNSKWGAEEKALPVIEQQQDTRIKISTQPSVPAPASLDVLPSVFSFHWTHQDHLDVVYYCARRKGPRPISQQ